tara:strand:- start:733 stop:882 length:150 start_codon:yes stop_codon:yes gene_type:complete
MKNEKTSFSNDETKDYQKHEEEDSECYDEYKMSDVPNYDLWDGVCENPF